MKHTQQHQAAGNLPPTSRASAARRAAVTRGLTQGGLPPDDIEHWVKLAELNGSNTVGLIQAGVAWHRVGIDARAATAWFQMDGWNPENALPWYLADFAPRDAELCDGLIFYAQQQQREGQPKPSNVAEWQQSDLPAAWICRALLLGLNTVRQARELFATNSKDPHLAGMIDLMRDVYAVGPAPE